MTEVSIQNRVVNWTQPMVEPCQEGLCAFICKNTRNFTFCRANKIKRGNFDIIEFAPIVQCLTGNYKETAGNLPFFGLYLRS